MKLYSGIIELKSGWFVRLPCPMTWLEINRWRFDPVTLMTVAIIGSTGIGFLGAIQQGKAAEQQAKNEAIIAEYNAKLAEQRAAEERKAAEYKARAFEEKGKRLLGEQKALYGVSGVEFIGSPLSVIEQTAVDLEMDRLMILREGEISYGQAMSSAAVSRMEGQAAKSRGSYAARGALLSATGTALTGLGSYAYYKYAMK